jgi:hypothetical protein
MLVAIKSVTRCKLARDLIDVVFCPARLDASSVIRNAQRIFRQFVL